MRTIQQSIQAQNDLNGILEYLELHNPSAAMKFAIKFDKAQRLIASHPGLIRTRDDLSPGLRSRVIGNCVLYYRFDSTTVTLVRIIHGRHDIDRIMKVYDKA